MNKSHYLKNYFKHNGVVLVCELLIVLLLSIACTLLLGGTPAWLAPALAVAAYILAELRFMMAYIAKCVKRDRMLEEQARAAEEDENADLPADDLPTEEEEAEFADEADEEYEDEDGEFVNEEEDADYAEEDAEDDEDIDAFETEDDEVSEASDADDEDIDTFEDEE